MHSPSFPKALENDPALVLWTMTAGISSAVVLLGLFPQWLPRRRALGRMTISAADAPLIYSFAAVLAVVALVLLLHRWRTLKALFQDGAEVSGRITSLRLEMHGGRATFTYQYQGTQYSSRVLLHKTAESSALTEGAEVLLLIDPANPRKAVIRSLYTASA